MTAILNSLCNLSEHHPSGRTEILASTTTKRNSIRRSAFDTGGLTC